MQGEIDKQWIVKRYGLFKLDFTYRLLVRTVNGKYFLSLGETGGFQPVDEDRAKKYINND